MRGWGTVDVWGRGYEAGVCVDIDDVLLQGDGEDSIGGSIRYRLGAVIERR